MLRRALLLALACGLSWGGSPSRASSGFVYFVSVNAQTGWELLLPGETSQAHETGSGWVGYVSGRQFYMYPGTSRTFTVHPWDAEGEDYTLKVELTEGAEMSSCAVYVADALFKSESFVTGQASSGFWAGLEIKDPTAPGAATFKWRVQMSASTPVGGSGDGSGTPAGTLPTTNPALNSKPGDRGHAADVPHNPGGTLLWVNSIEPQIMNLTQGGDATGGTMDTGIWGKGDGPGRIGVWNIDLKWWKNSSAYSLVSSFMIAYASLHAFNMAWRELRRI